MKKSELKEYIREIILAEISEKDITELNKQLKLESEEESEYENYPTSIDNPEDTKKTKIATHDFVKKSSKIKKIEKEIEEIEKKLLANTKESIRITNKFNLSNQNKKAPKLLPQEKKYRDEMLKLSQLLQTKKAELSKEKKF